jgi:2-amino-4-hydroxy-6-hydroxymethyldihydropteridine diphosphokinase
MSNCYLLLGTNQANRKNNLEKALEKIREKIGKIIVSSSVYETEAWGLEDQPDFLNQACIVSTTLTPVQILKTLKEIEKSMGRTETIKWGPRLIDIDIIYVDDLVMQTPELVVPHPGLYNRNFVLLPLIEIAGDFTDPVKKISLDEIYDSSTDTKEVYVFDDEA